MAGRTVADHAEKKTSRKEARELTGEKREKEEEKRENEGGGGLGLLLSWPNNNPT